MDVLQFVWWESGLQSSRVQEDAQVLKAGRWSFPLVFRKWHAEGGTE